MSGLALSVPLVVACFLEPSPQHRGTHQQLGLPPCTFVLVFGLPCPTCGMTTAWAHLVRGEWIEALRANVGGTLLALLNLVAVPWLLLSAARGRWLGWAPSDSATAWTALAIATVTIVDWCVRLVTGWSS